ncbi:uncharacterized protein I303_108535 [Kwoniella dejecticola CBS 10117]|uniref:CD2 antigen cytoplasmic tail-binding protein 2 n=1 Tax=Kwoniella dejecticola CBS 10117 TaxID=1296121 RepID=A0A1A5ZX52_9TREE|nr:CD2 antigen cytoplasmic tail-binding protein 2 [Kwoniella dejecticola CBS 10117]OBR82382.1 CD2 antigen cytoplasmic tail-binding protein 2 [Kwoniella dejecticola CBS 10117]
MPAKRSAGSSSAAPKRTRFGSSPLANSPGASNSANDEDDGMLDDDLQQGAARDKQRAKRSLQDTEGYGSDSSNDDEGVVPSRRPGAKPEEEEEDDVDMFASDVEEKAPSKDEKGKGKSKGKEKEFMDLNEIEGQEFAQQRSTNLGGDSDSDGDSEDEGEGKKGPKKEGLDGDMGSEITPFNMKNEMTEGRFTADGEAYMENDKDENDKHDSWLNDPNLNKESIRKARKAHKERERLEKEREEKENSGENKAKERELLREAVGLMERGETILEALQRLGKAVEVEKDRIARKQGQGKKKLSWAERQKERKKMMAVDQEQADPTHTSNPFTNLSNIVSQLTTSGQIDVYSISRESIQRMLPPETSIRNTNGSASTRPSAPPPESPTPADTRQFHYRFSMAYVRNLPEAQRPVEREVFGPFPPQQLKQWRNTGFFGGPACENVELRLAGSEEGGSWGTWADVVGQ